MIDFSQAIKVARQYALDVLGEKSTSVEEIERQDYDGRDVWNITLGIPKDKDRMPGPLARFSVNPFDDTLDYKRFLVDAETGEFVAMKLRELIKA